MATEAPIQPVSVDRNPGILRTELLIARLLRIGVTCSFVILAIGIGSILVTGQTGYQQIRLDDVQSIVTYHAEAPDLPNSFGDIVVGLFAIKPYAIIILGLVILIAIPVLRVAVSVVAFTRERDWTYVLITVFVLAMLILSLVLGGFEG